MKPDGETLSSPTEYAFWVDQGGAARVQYSLPAFHEIDFQVNEGYRRIPHGGVEIGGILWGRKAADAVVIEAFRQIECEHASGPSFSLSERDLAGIQELLTRARSEEELRTLEPVGWFVAHTRSPLTLTDRELAIFDRFFPGPEKITMLVKPERFQPTRFGFLVRRDDGSIARDAAPDAFILPLPGRAGKGVVASIPAPAVKKAPAAVEIEVKAQAAEPVSIPPEPERVEMAPVEVRQPAPAPVPVPMPEPAISTATPPQKRKEQFRGAPPAEATPAPPLPIAASRSSSSTFRLFLLLVVAAGLGCGVGYLAYLQLPSPYIALEVQKRASALVVQWPAVQTKGVEYAAVRVDDGPPQLLSEGEKDSGHVEVQARTDNTKIEIIAQHWIRDSRGIVRYLSAAPVSAQTVPANSVDSPSKPLGAAGQR